ncbi:MAG: class I SAM-dependent methyltransferase [Magnetococcales bacterium]|nr:class I SAM-dependent methyltransferase [Magnetococcales bacterium]
MDNLCISTTDNTLTHQAHSLADRLGIPFTQSNNRDQNAFHLVLTPERLELQTPNHPRERPIYVDFVGGVVGFRRRDGRHPPLARAVGVKGNFMPYVVDATAGLGRDGFQLASQGCKVTMIERSLATYALLENGLQRARIDQETALISSRITLIYGDSLDIIHNQNDVQNENQKPDTIYLDPMFPHRKKSALVKKEMRHLRQLAGDDLDAPALLEDALNHAGYRVVVKRPRQAPPLTGPKPAFQLTGKTTRFDVYVIGTI